MATISSAARRLLWQPRQTFMDGDAVVAVAATLAAGAAVGALTVASLQAALAAVLVIGVLALWSRARAMGVAALWLLWFVMPGVRRVFSMIEHPNYDPLSVVPFVATGAVALLEFVRTDLSLRARRVLGLAALGLCLGLPVAFTHPSAGLFGLAAYGGALAAFVIGYAEGQGGSDSFTLRRVLVLLAPALALYGVLQYFLPLASWDSFWLQNIDFQSINAPETDHIRVFSTLNAPQPLATVLAVALVFLIAARRLSAGVLVSVAIVAAGLALTYARSAFVSLAAGLIALALATRGRVMPRVVGILAACLATVVLLSPVSSTASAVLDRVTTLGTPEEDVSVKARTSTATELFPVALATPLGHGLGSTGEPSKLGGSEGPTPYSTRYLGVDNAYLGIAWQTGPIGLLLVVGAALYSLGMAVRTAAGGDFERGALLVSALVLLLVYAAGHDVFYGVSGAVLWYLVGKSIWLADHARAAAADPTAARVRGAPVASWGRS
jgi:putative inorganic carbon (hco3(-)) transporter